MSTVSRGSYAGDHLMIGNPKAKSPWIEKYRDGDDIVCVRLVGDYFSFQVNYNSGIGVAHDTGYMTEDKAIRAGKNKLKNLKTQLRNKVKIDRRTKEHRQR